MNVCFYKCICKVLIEKKRQRKRKNKKTGISELDAEKCSWYKFGTRKNIQVGAFTFIKEKKKERKKVHHRCSWLNISKLCSE